MALFLVFTVVTTYICFANGQSSCTKPDGGIGQCISVYSCEPILALIKKQDKTQADLDLVKKSQCGFKDGIPQVCCTGPCYTPDGQQGKCQGIYSCPHLANLLRPPISDANKLYVQSSRCEGTEQYSVCCGPPPSTTSVVTGNCASTNMNGLPPNPKTECCGVESRVENKIVGGNVTTVDQYPWLALIEYIQGTQIKLLCGGVLISSRYTLTAAHCVAGEILSFAKPSNVRLGEYDTKNEGPDCTVVEAGGLDCTEGTVIIPIETYMAHPNYKTNKKQSPDDIALIRMKEAAPYTDFIRPICLPTTDITLQPPANFTMFVAGWGAVSLQQSSSNIKLFVGLPYVARKECQSAYTSSVRNLSLKPGQICAGGQPGKDSCKGDSGGPLMYENGKTFEVIGIVSFGPSPCGLPNVPGVYTKVFEYNTWIRSNMIP